MTLNVLMPHRILERPTGGNSTYARALAQGLRERGVGVGTIPAGANPAATAIAESWFALSRLPSHTVAHYTADTGPLLGTRLPCLLTLHGVASRWIDVARTPTQERIWRFRVGRAVSAADHVVTVSRSSARDIAEVFGLGGDRVTVIPHGISQPAFAVRGELSQPLAELLPERYVLYLGNIEPRKNLVELVEAFNTPPLRGLGAKLVVAGRRAWNFRESMEAITASPHAIYLDYVPDSDVAPLMRGASLFAFPSLYEGFGLPVLEALATGVPVLTSDRGSLPEVAGPAMQAHDIDRAGLAEAVVRCLTDRQWRQRCRDEGPAWAAGFSWDRCVDAHLTIYQELAR